MVDVATRSVVLSGEFDVTAARALTARVVSVHDQNPGEVAVDLADVVFLDAAGLSALVTLVGDPTCHRVTALRMSGASRVLRRVLEAVGLAQLLPAPQLPTGPAGDPPAETGPRRERPWQ